MTRWTTLVVFLAVGSLRLDAAQTLSNITFDEDYDVFYQEQFHALSPIVKAAVPRAYQHVIHLWGLQDIGGLRHPLTVQIKEVPSKTLGRWEAAYVQARSSGDDLRQTLVVDIQTYMQHPDEDLDLLITHEMSHVLLMDVVTGPRTPEIPPWFNEGLAQSSTVEGHERVRGDIQALAISGMEPISCDLAGPVDEFAHGPFNGKCYPEFYLAVQRLKQLGGNDVVQKVIVGLRNGTRLTDMMPSLIGKDWAAFQQDARDYTGKVLAGRKPIP